MSELKQINGRYKLGENRRKVSFTGAPEKYPQGYFNPKPCKECGKEFEPISPSHLYCTDECVQLGYDRARMMKVYGITLEEYFEMVDSHAGLCAICGRVGFQMGKNQKLLLVIDHCHESGKVRGLLCHNCNRGLGLFKDNVESLTKAIEYLQKE